MEVAREKPLAPTLFDVVAPRTLPEPAGSASFRDCLVSPSNGASPVSSSTASASSATTNHPPEHPATHDAKPAHDDRRSDQEQAERAAQVESQSDTTKSKDEATAQVVAESPESTQASETTAEAPAEPSSEGEETSEQTTDAAELVAAVQAAGQAAERPLPAEIKQDDGATASLSLAEGEATESDKAAQVPGESPANALLAESAVAESTEVVDTANTPAMVTTGEVVSARVVENEQTNETGESAVAVLENVDTVKSPEVALPQSESTVVGESPSPVAMPAAVQASEQGQHQSDNEQQGKPDERSPKVTKKSAAKGEAVDVKPSTNETAETVTDAPLPAVAAKDSEPSKEEPKPENVEARGAEANASRPTTSPVADSVTPSTSPPGPEPSTSATASDLSAPIEPNTAAAGTNPSASAIPTAAPRVPPALLRKVDSSSSTHVRPGEIDPARFLSRVVKAFESAQQRDTEVRLRLHPSELGALSIEVKVQDSVLTARLQAETPEARTALLDNLPMLRERLADQGIRIEKFDVDLMDHSDRQPQQSPSEQMPDDSGRRSAQSRMPTTTAKAIEKDNKTTTARGGSATDRLNVVI